MVWSFSSNSLVTTVLLFKEIVREFYCNIQRLRFFSAVCLVKEEEEEEEEEEGDRMSSAQGCFILSLNGTDK